MPSKSKTKGSGYEREQSKFLSDTFGGSFIRVPNSGAYIGGKNNKRTAVLSSGQVKSFKGDIIPPDDWQFFNCECKFYADFLFHQLIYPQEITILEKWIDQMMEVAEAQDLNVLFMKFNRKGQFVAYQKKLWDQGMCVDRHVQYQSKNNGAWIFTSAEDFWKNCKDSVAKISVVGYDSSANYA